MKGILFCHLERSIFIIVWDFIAWVDRNVGFSIVNQVGEIDMQLAIVKSRLEENPITTIAKDPGLVARDGMNRWRTGIVCDELKNEVVGIKKLNYKVQGIRRRQNVIFDPLKSGIVIFGEEKSSHLLFCILLSKS